MKHSTRLAAFMTALSLAAGTCLTGCTTYDNFMAAIHTDPNAVETVEPVRIGVFEPMSGSEAEGAKAEIMGIELAHSLYPEVLGRPVELVYADNKSDIAEVPNAVQELIDKQVSVVLGSYRNVLSMAAEDLFAENKLPAIGITCTNPLLTQTCDYYYRVCVVDAYQGTGAAQFILQYLRRNGAAILKQEGDDYATSMANQFESEVYKVAGQDEGIAVVEYPEGTEDFEPYLIQLAESGYDCVFFPSKTDVALKVLAQAHELDIWLNWVGNSYWDNIRQDALNAGYEDLEFIDDINYVTDFDANAEMSSATEEFRTAYQESYGEDALPSEATALGFDAYMLAIRAIEQAGDDKNTASIAIKIKYTRNLDGATGNISLSSVGDPMKDVVIERIINGDIVAAFTASTQTMEVVQDKTDN